MAAISFDEWWDTIGCKIGCDTCAASAAWDASKLEEAPSASANTESDAISALREEVAELRKEVARHRSFVGMHTPLGGDSARF